MPAARDVRAADSARPARVVVVGGGSAGYVAALTIQRLAGNVEVTILDPDSIPTIGVGESTTSEMPPFLHRVLGIDVGRFYREVQPTLKLGIHFLWGPPNHEFDYPFDRGDLRGSHLHDGHFGNATLGTMLMAADRAPVLDPGGGHCVSLLDCQPYGYHIDNARFLAFVRGVAIERGVRVCGRVVKDFGTDADGNVTAIGFDDGTRASFDLYVDCTGFRRAILGRTLHTPFISFRGSLFCDAAVTGTLPHGGRIKPYTTAETMANGWLWNIPQRDCDHVGYVYASAYCDAAAARRELARHAPDIAFERDIRFESGRLERWIAGNVVAIGNAFSFVEPLESTALFVMVRQSLLAARNLPALVAGDRATAQRLNAYITSMWDYLRWFLAIHYRFNRRLETAFWDDCRAAVDISGAAQILERCRGTPGAAARHAPDAPPLATNFDAFGYEALLLGQGVPVAPPAVAADRARREAQVAQRRTLVAAAMPQRRALAALEADDARELVAHLATDGSWLTRFAGHLLAVA